MRKRWIIIAASVVLLAFLLLLILHNQPFIYESEIVSTINAIKKADPDLTIAVCTDIHYDPAKKEPVILTDTMDCMAELGKRIRTDALWNLGDLINGQGSRKTAEEQIRTVVEAEKAVTGLYHNIQGNHDNNIQATYGKKGLPDTEVLSNEELNKLLENPNAGEIHSGKRPTDYYVDYPTIRVVCITAENTKWTEETAAWLKSTALNTEKEVLILAHIPTRPEWGFRNDVQNGEMIEEALRAFISGGGTIIAYIHGHDHGDMINDADGWKEVAVGCARFQVPTSNGTVGMTFQNREEKDVTKILFDMVCINQKKREVHFIRFGAGDNRVIHY